MNHNVIEAGQIINTIVIDPANVERYEQITGWSLEPVPMPEPEPEIDWAQAYIDLAAENAARELGLEV